MMTFDWSKASSTLKDFGGEAVTLFVPKTGLLFFDVLQLYGAIDLYIGLREDVEICDKGNEWEITGRRRAYLDGRDEAAFKQVWGKRRPEANEYCSNHLQPYLFKGQIISESYSVEGEKKYDAALQTGIRGISACSYETLQTGQTSKAECKADIPLGQGLLAYAGRKRTESLGNILFLPVFEGRIDLSKVVSPLRAWLGLPNVICSQALALLSLKSSLFSEGYEKKLSAVVFNTNLGSQRSDNYSGLISIKSTAIDKIGTADFTSHVYRIFRNLVSKGWSKKGRDYKATEFASDTLAMAYWLMQPVGKHLSSMITSQERMKAKGYSHIFIKQVYVKEVFSMSYGDWKGDHEAVRKFAKAVASAIYFARQSKAGEGEKGKAWYDEVVMLRSAPSARAFRERALILLEQGHREHGQIGTVHRNEDYNPSALLASIGEGRDFETFRDLFRMYLIQESTYKAKETVDVPDRDISEVNNSNTEEELQ
ncbi:MAG: hypothetical protein E3K36_06505 [Candidatus Brocadia sp.]|nr:hypothetical protein [Candidatus Brocadia sp.]